MREKRPNAEFFLVRILPHSDRIRRDTEYLFVFSPNAGKYGPEKTPYLDTFHALIVFMIVFMIRFKEYAFSEQLLLATSVCTIIEKTISGDKKKKDMKIIFFNFDYYISRSKFSNLLQNFSKESIIWHAIISFSLHNKCPNSEFFLVRTEYWKI